MIDNDDISLNFISNMKIDFISGLFIRDYSPLLWLYYNFKEVCKYKRC